MQFKIAKILNNTLIIITVIILAIVGGYFYVRGNFPDFTTTYTIAGVAVAVLLLALFKWLEGRWDKKVITKMAGNGKIALAKIKSAKRVIPMRDSNFTNYWLYEFEGEIFDQNGGAFEKKFYEKMNCDTDTVPQGTVYITYDESKPDQIFIIPNVLISHLPNLMPIVAKYEKNKKIGIKYLDVFYNKGMVIKTFRETVEQNRADAAINAKKKEQKKK